MRVNKRIIIFVLVFLAGTHLGICEEYPFSNKDRDPFSPLVNKVGRILIFREMDVSSFVLTGIIYSENSALAIINEEIVKKNDKIGDYVIFKVEEKQVILKKGEEETILKLEGE
jgi:hypothetical protein